VNENLIHSFASKRQALLVMCILARTTGTGGKRCFSVEEHNSPWGDAGKVDTFYHLRFLPEVWRKVAGKHPDADPPTVREMGWFVRGYLRALTGVKPTVL
jgi:hypothetical protein